MPTPNAEERNRIVNATVNILKKNNPNLLNPPPKTDLDLLQERTEAVTLRVRALYKPILDSLRGNGVDITIDKERKNMLNQIHRFYVEEFKSFDKDELIFVCSLVHAHLMRDTIV